MNKMNKYDIDDQFLTGAWVKMREQLDKELPVQKPWYFNKIWYVTGIAASLLLFTGFYCYNYGNFESTIQKANQYNTNSATNINASKNDEENNKTALAEVIENKVMSSGTDVEEMEDLTLMDKPGNSKNGSFKSNEGNLLIEARNKSINTSIQNEINKTENHLTKNQVYKINTKTSAGTSKANAQQNPVTTKPVTSKILEVAKISPLISAIETTSAPAFILNENRLTKNNKLNSTNNNKTNTVFTEANIENNGIATTNETIDFLPVKTFQLNSNFNYEIAALHTDTPNSKIWQPKKPISFGLAIGLSSNIKDASAIRAGLFTNYKFSDKLMIGASIAYNYTATNTNYNVRYNLFVPAEERVDDFPGQESPQNTQKSIVDEINYNVNYHGVHSKLLFGYLPVKRLGIAVGLFGAGYVFNNTSIDFLQENEAYTDRNLGSNYSYNNYKAGPVFELQYWLKPKLNIAATFEMNLIPEVKQEFWATTKQDYLSNSFGVALQYQFN